MSETPWHIILDGQAHAERHMPLDEALARRAEPTVRFFAWAPPGVSLGWKQRRPDWLEPERWAAAGLALVERPTGGGLAVHGSDCSIAVVIPRALNVPLAVLMRRVCEEAGRLCRSYGADAQVLLDAPAEGRVTYCLTELNPFAVLVGTRKVAGFALRRYPQSWLIQGSLLVRPLPSVLAEAMPDETNRMYEARAVSLSDAAGRSLTESNVMTRWAEHWAAWWDEVLAEELSVAHAV